MPWTDSKSSTCNSYGPAAGTEGTPVEDSGKIPSKVQISKLIEEHFYLRYASDSVTCNADLESFPSSVVY